jgi:hypothetical protein
MTAWQSETGITDPANVGGLACPIGEREAHFRGIVCDIAKRKDGSRVCVPADTRHG